jgi:hypothetical protein
LVAAADDLSGENPPRDDEVRQVVQDWLAATQRELDAALDAAQLDAANRVRRASADAAAIVAAARSRHRGPAAWR